jgi:hypothetical protein
MPSRLRNVRRALVLDAATLAKAIVSSTASQSVQTVMDRVPTADEKRVGATIADEVGRIEKVASLMLAHIEGHYESRLANARLKLHAHQPWVQALVVAAAVIIGFAVGRSFK